MANIQPAAPNPITDQNRAYVLAQLQAQRAAQYAQALTEQGDAPIQYDQRGPISWTQGLAKMLDAYAGKKMSDKAIDQQAEVRAMGAQLMGQAYGMPQAGVTPPAAPGSLGTDIPPDTAAGFTPPADHATAAPPSPAALASALQGGNSTPINPYGAPPMVAMAAAQGDPAAKSMLDTFLKGKELTPEQRNSQDPVIGASVRSNLQTQNMTEFQKLQTARKLVADGSPQAQQIDAQIAKLNYVAPAEIKQGNVALNRDNKPIFYNPKTADGITPMFQTTDGVTMPTGAQALPGYAGANAGIQGAEQRAKQDNTILTNVGIGGGITRADYGGNIAGENSQGTWTGGQLTPQQIEQLKAGAANGNKDAAAALDAYNNAMSGPRRTGVYGQSTADAQINEISGKTIASLPQSVSQARQVQQSLQNALTALDGTKTGPGTAGAFKLTATLQNLGLPVANSPTENYQTLSKYLNNALALSAAVTGNNRSDANMEQFMHGQPSADLMNKAPLRGAINYVLSQMDAIPASAHVIQSEYEKRAAAGDPRASYNALKAWQDAYDPRVFQFNRMSPEEKAAFKASLPADQREAFGKKYNQLHQSGWVN